MSTEENAMKARSDIDRRDHIRYRAPEDTYVDVELPCGAGTLARLLDASPFGGACLVFDGAPELEIGDVVRILIGSTQAAGEVRHARELGTESRVGVYWTAE